MSHMRTPTLFAALASRLNRPNAIVPYSLFGWLGKYRLGLPPTSHKAGIFCI